VPGLRDPFFNLLGNGSQDAVLQLLSCSGVLALLELFALGDRRLYLHPLSW